MKRRDFLSAAASAGVTGALLTRAASAAEVPCPPPSVSVQGGSSAGTTCTPPPPPVAPGSAPAWFVNTPDGTWTKIAGSQGQRIVDVLPSPVPNSGLSGEDPQSLVTAWAGASMEQARGEYMFIAGGGHADYPGNEGYALSLRSATPAWRRISDPTPNSHLTALTSTNGVLTYNDGRPRADHTSGWPTWGDGRVWFPAQSAATSGGGSASPGVYSYNRDSLGNATTPMPHSDNGGSVNPWMTHGTIPGMENAGANGSFTFGCAVFDRVNHYVYGLSGFGYDRTMFYYWRTKTSGSSIGVVDHCFTANGGNPFANALWAACAYDLGIIVMGDGSPNQRIIVLDLTKVGQSGDWTPITNVSGSGYFGPTMKGCGANYIVANNTIGIGDPFAIGGKIYRLQIPTKVVNGAKVYNSSGQWAWTSFSPGGVQPVPSPRDVGTYTKFNLIEDMGNGQSAFVYCGDINGATYVYKIPIAGL
jgi:hypothetical protein